MSHERRSNRTKQFMNLLNEAKEGNISLSGEKGATGGPASTPPHVSTNVDPANVQIVNELNSFNLENITPPIAPKWKHSETLLDEYHKFKCSCQRIFDGPMCHIKSGKVKTSTCSLFGLVLMGKTFMRASICYPIRPMTLN